MINVAICAPSAPFNREDARHVDSVASDCADLHLYFHRQCYETDGHFAGSDELRMRTFVELANDPYFDAVWFARGGYGSNRIAEAAMAQLGPAARNKQYFGYSDGGYLLAALYRAGIGQSVHAPMPADIRREGGEVAVRRVVDWFGGDRSGLEPSLDDRPTAAFNLTTIAMLCGTPMMPDLTGHVVMVEEVSEHLYAVDRLFFHCMAHLTKIAGLRLGRVSDVPENDRAFSSTAEEIARYWCARHGIPYLGPADIGHDSANRIVPFGLATARRQP